MKIVLVRHGQTEINKQNKVQGWSDHPLNEIGINQAKRVGNYFQVLNKRFDGYISSPLKRAYHTGEIILECIKETKPLIIDYHFIERDFGVFENRNVPDVMPLLLEKNFTLLGFEDSKMLERRVMNGIIGLYDTYRGKEILIFCHSHVIKAALILADPKTYTYHTFLDNGSMHAFNFDGETLKVLDFNKAV